MYRTRLIKNILLAAVVVLFSAAASYAVTVPQMINYSGTLTNNAGQPVANGNYNIEFRIYSQATGGTALWTEKWDTTTSQVTVVNGVFNVMLGAIDQQNNSIPVNLFQENTTTYLGIKVGTDSEMTPRQRITSVGYALSAWNGVPKGGIIMWSGATTDIPAGWALCDGSNGTPDLKDKFIVGAGGGYAVGAMGGASAHQHGIVANDLNHYHGVYGHTHNYSGATGTESSNSGFDDNDSSGQHNAANPNHTHTYSGSTDGGTSHTTNFASEQGWNLNHNHGGATQSTNNLPPYYALAFIMKL